MIPLQNAILVLALVFGSGCTVGWVLRTLFPPPVETPKPLPFVVPARVVGRHPDLAAPYTKPAAPTQPDFEHDPFFRSDDLGYTPGGDIEHTFIGAAGTAPGCAGARGRAMG
jgi:hypothetical protein